MKRKSMFLSLILILCLIFGTSIDASAEITDINDSNNYPVVIGVSTSNPSNTWGEDHAVVVHSYMVGYDGVPFVFVNNTFGSNDISVNGSLTYFSGKEMWYVN